MTESIYDDLFSPKPIVRLDAATKATAPMVTQLVPPCDKWIAQAFGAANAWLVVVGPSPGKGPGGKIKVPVQPVLGRVLPEFKSFAEPSVDTRGFWRELFRLLRQGFKRACLGRVDEDAALKITMLVNLDTTPEGDAAKVSPEKLMAGLPRLKRAADITNPHLILALTKAVYEEIRRWWSREIGKVEPEQKHPVHANKCYHGRSCWLTRENGESILLVKILQHPSKANTYSGYGALFSDYIGDRIVEVLTSKTVNYDGPVLTQN